MNSSAVHKKLVTQLKEAAGTGNASQSSDSYTGSKHWFYAVPVPWRRQLIKNCIKEYKATASNKEWHELIDSLAAGKSHEEKTMAAYLVEYLPAVRAQATFAQIERWLGELNGWAEIDALGYNNWQPDELLENWSAWKKFLITLSKDKNINLRRAALVLLTGPCSKSDDQRLHTCAYALIDRLKSEPDILITKAISWLLRSMVDSRPTDVQLYLDKNQDTLPKIASRETKRKLLTGKKN